ncbi:MAG: 2,3-bisphosphoglycerate-independent phosphoglycerate mutase [Methanocellales archaeon]|nr:2,3-bisphosphoglycerate-independent phosphoglycerate mutase [Methanocellales archaeon]
MSIARKILLVILDGVSDRPIEGKTPLQSANAPNLDRIANLGINGIMDTIAPGIRPGSDVAHLALLGYSPYEVYTGRGPLEAAGIGIRLNEGDIAFRCNFATMKDDIIVDRRAGRIRDTMELTRAVQDGVQLDVEFTFERSTGHRAVLVLRGRGLSSHVSDSDPKHEGTPSRIIEALKPEAQKTADILKEFVIQAGKLLEKHPVNAERIKTGKAPANTILIRGAGMKPNIKTFSERYGLKGAIIAETGLVIGIGRICGLNHIEADGADSDIDANVRSAIDALKDHEFVLLNIKGADDASHDGSAEKKIKFITKIDKALKPILDIKNALVVVTADHSTPVSIKDHSADPVPVTIMGPGVRVDAVRVYDEINAATGGLNRIRAIDLMPILMDLVNRTKKFGA